MVQWSLLYLGSSGTTALLHTQNIAAASWLLLIQLQQALLTSRQRPAASNH
jgi:hypothetical protein